MDKKIQAFLKYNFELICRLCVHQVLLVDLQSKLASCVLRVTTATREEWLSQVASVQKATTVLRDRAPRDHNSMSAQWDIVARRSSTQYSSLSYCQSSFLSIVCLCMSLSPQLWFSFYHEKCITAYYKLIDVFFLFFLNCLSPLPVLRLSQSRLLLFHYVYA